jgi:peptidoglycan/LPS O-acetylase OafA/YrhL
MSTARLTYRPALDGVRGIAIAIVVLFHAFGWPGEGTFGVDLFFVLSGFLITLILLKEHSESGAIRIRAFYYRRARRLLPALFTMLVPFMVVALVTASPLAMGLATCLTYTTNILVAAGDSQPYLTGFIHMWSLAAEEQFYIVWPLLLLLLLRIGGARTAARGLIALLAVAMIYRLVLLLQGVPIGRLYYGPDTHADSLLVGCLSGCYYARGRLPRIISSPRVREWSIAAALLLIIAAAVFAAEIPPRLAYGTQLVPTVFALVAGVLVTCAALGGSTVARALSVRPLVFLGQISYSLYLWHLPLLVYVFGGRDGGIRSSAAVATAVGVAAASRHFIELPFLSQRAPGYGHASRKRPSPALRGVQ